MPVILTPQHGIRKIGGKDVKIVEAPRFKRLGFVRGIFDALLSVARGMKVTFGYFRRPSTVVTQFYPENRATLKMFDRYRAQLAFVRDENGYHKCTACEACQTACPNGSIHVVGMKGEVSKKTEIDEFIWRMDSCTFCNACVQVCPYGALEFNGNFESSVYDRRLLIYNLAPYAGATANVLNKTPEAADRAKMMSARGPISGPIPLLGESIPGVTPLEGMKTEKAKAE